MIPNVATAKATEGNSYFDLAIRGTVLAMTLALGSFSGCAFDTAVALGVALYSNDCCHIWVYMVGCFGDGILAGVVFNFLNAE